MHKSLLGRLYCSTPFLQLTIRVSVLHHFVRYATFQLFSYSSQPFKNTHTHTHIHVWKDRVVHTDTTTAPLSVLLERWEFYYPAVRTCRMPSSELDPLWKGDAANTTSFLEAARPFCTLIGRWRAEGTQFNFPSQVHKTSTSTATGPIHNSLLVMCVLNTAEIYMGTICKFFEGPPPASTSCTCLTDNTSSSMSRRQPLLDNAGYSRE